jgi:hypothetical protein
MSELCRRLCLVGNAAHRAALTTQQGWLSGVLDRVRLDASALVLPEIGVLDSAGPRTGELWSNSPQTYLQVGLILSAICLSRSSEEALWHAS